MNINEINIGDVVKERIPTIKDKFVFSPDMEVVGVHKDSKGGVAYLDLKGNEGGYLEFDIKDLVLVRKWNEGTDERCCGACRHFAYEDTDGYGTCLCLKNESQFISRCSNVCGNFENEDKNKGGDNKC